MSDDNEIVDAPADGSDVIADVMNGDASALRNRNILDLPVRIMVSVGAAQLTVQELLDLKQETVIDLESLLEDPVDIFVGERLIARGELVEASDNENGIGVKLVEICGLGA